MPAYKDSGRNTWYVKFKYKNWKNDEKWVTKRGFQTRREAIQWEREFQLKQQGSIEMTFTDFVNVYREDRVARLKESTSIMNDNIIDTKLVPWLSCRFICL